ncbi:MAG: prolyl oligopeptidase family serine peptidase [Marinobacter sp.]|uniref:alpha/beta hydrolase family protein n=1 Tax=Marinobacter sp. TaxID=50741 RepID=UPI00396D6CA3
MPTTPGSSSGAEASRKPRGASLSSPLLSAQKVCAGHAQRAELAVSDAGLFWLEADPDRGCNVIRHLGEQGLITLPTGTTGIGSRINGYGGGSLAVLGDRVTAVTDQQQLIAVSPTSSQPVLVLDEPEASWGGLVADGERNRVLAVREAGGRQQLVAIAEDGRPQIFHEGEDFYGAPALSPDGHRVAWISWQLPDMPWLRTRLWTGELDSSGQLQNLHCVSAPAEGSIQQPFFEGQDLWVLSDHDGWWQPWRLDQQGRDVTWHSSTAPRLDHANAPWQLGERHHCPLLGGGWARVRYREGAAELWVSAGKNAEEIRVAETFTDFRSLAHWRGQLFCVARSSDRLDAIVEVNPGNGAVRILAGFEQPFQGYSAICPDSFTVPAPDSHGLPVQGFLYTPEPVPDEPPPLILVAHGGPTSAAYPVYNPQIQFWCQRGFAVAEVNYRGSSGFGRRFRLALAGHWGEIDVTDMSAAADYLASRGLADRQRTFIQGRSSGGYTALMTLIGSDRFVAGASLFGVTDPMRLRTMTHRFESGYLDWLLGSPDLHPERWQARTPLHHAARIRAPLIFFQGGQDRVVVPDQTRAMVEAMKAAGGAPELHWFEDEGHGFRQRHNQASMLEWLHSFYRRHSQKANNRPDDLR